MASDDPTPQDPARIPPGTAAKPDASADAKPADGAPADGEAAAATPADAAALEQASVAEAPAAEPTPTEAARAQAVRDDAPEPDAYEPSLAPESAEVPPVRAARPSPWGAILSGALAGAVVAVAAAWALTHYVPAPGQSGANARLDALEARLAADHTTEVQRITQLETALKQIAPPDLQPLTAAIAQLRAGDSRTQSDLAALRTQQQALQAALQGGTDSAKAQVADLGRKIDGLQKRIEEVSVSAQAMDRAAAAVAVLALLRDAVVSGRPFATELDAARAILGPSAAGLDPFTPAAATGYATPAKLATRLADLGAAALAAQPGAPRADSLVNRLMSSAEGLVRVTPPDGSAAAPEATAQLQQAVNAVRAGEFDAALADLKKLPAPVIEKLKPVIAEIEGRRDAAAAATSLFQQALAAISGKVP